ncbi:FecR family protein [Dysgonomonas massiliensis]|uniref:FecR family protein n=1 Tax=Dysgonomonas massiliensis TaxID=2040292 RepID=UPI000C764F31|nr:FecR domain-containing protein [Dysgonomonas massiliensis]
MNTELLHKFFAGKASNEEILKIKSWTEQSDENLQELISERKIYDTIQLNIHNPLTVVSEVTIDEQPVRRFSMNSFAKEFLKIASVVLITILASWMLFNNNKINPNELAMQTIKVPAGQRINVVLPDGTSVWVNSKSTLTYPVAFNTEQRNVYLEGQAYFDVAKNKDVPFIVNTQEGSVKALGTAFDVISLSDDNIFETMLLEGSVEVSLSTDLSRKVILIPNQKATVSEGDFSITTVEDQNPYEWRNGLVSFRNKKFKEIMTILEKTYDIDIELKDANVGDQMYTGKFRISDGIQYALDVLSLYKKIDYKIDYENRIIHVKSSR